MFINIHIFIQVEDLSGENSHIKKIIESELSDRESWIAQLLALRKVSIQRTSSKFSLSFSHMSSFFFLKNEFGNL